MSGQPVIQYLYENPPVPPAQPGFSSSSAQGAVRGTGLKGSSVSKWASASTSTASSPSSKQPGPSPVWAASASQAEASSTSCISVRADPLRPTSGWITASDADSRVQSIDTPSSTYLPSSSYTAPKPSAPSTPALTTASAIGTGSPASEGSPGLSGTTTHGSIIPQPEQSEQGDIGDWSSWTPAHPSGGDAGGLEAYHRRQKLVNTLDTARAPLSSHAQDAKPSSSWAQSTPSAPPAATKSDRPLGKPAPEAMLPSKHGSSPVSETQSKKEEEEDPWAAWTATTQAKKGGEDAYQARLAASRGKGAQNPAQNRAGKAPNDLNVTRASALVAAKNSPVVGKTPAGLATRHKKKGSTPHKQEDAPAVVAKGANAISQGAPRSAPISSGSATGSTQSRWNPGSPPHSAVSSGSSPTHSRQTTIDEAAAPLKSIVLSDEAQVDGSLTSATAAVLHLFPSEVAQAIECNDIAPLLERVAIQVPHQEETKWLPQARRAESSFAFEGPAFVAGPGALVPEAGTRIGSDKIRPFLTFTERSAALLPASYAFQGDFESLPAPCAPPSPLPSCGKSSSHGGQSRPLSPKAKPFTPSHAGETLINLGTAGSEKESEYFARRRERTAIFDEGAESSEAEELERLSRLPSPIMPTRRSTAVCSEDLKESTSSAVEPESLATALDSGTSSSDQPFHSLIDLETGEPASPAAPQTDRSRGPASSNEIRVQQQKHFRMEISKHEHIGQVAETILELLDGLPKKDRAMCMFNDAFLEKKIQQAAQIATLDDDE